MRFALLSIAGICALSRCVFAHPMGNFSVNHYAAIKIGSTAVEIRYLVDMAEIPTFQEMQEGGMQAKTDGPAVASYLARKGDALRNGLLLQVNGHSLHLKRISQSVIFPPGAGGLPTMKLGFVYRASLDALALNGTANLYYRDDNFPDRAGWKEIVASTGQGVRLPFSSVPVKDRSAELTNYPTDLLNSPPQSLEASVKFVASPFGHPVKQAASKPAPIPVPSPAPVLQANKQETPRSAFTELINKQHFGFWFLLTAALIAAELGAFHALEPGHGKTIVAAYLVGSQGTALHACLLGLIVTASHTAGVYLLGAATLYASRYIVPEQLYPWLGVASGLIIAGLGIYLLIQRYAGKGHHGDHSHSHAHGHADHHHHEPHDHHHHHHHEHERISYRQLLTLGVTGGIVPCPAALVVLLSAVALHRIAFGLFLILAFSVGLAAVLIVIGLLMVYARRFMSHIKGEGPLITRWLPITSAAFITFLGLAIAFRALTTAGILTVRI